MTAKQYGYIILGLLALILIWGIVRFFATRPAPTHRANIGQSSEEILLINDKLFFPQLVQENQKLFGLVDHGTRFILVDLATKQRQDLFQEPIDIAPDEVRVAPDASAAIVHREVTREAEALTRLYDFKTGKFQELNAAIRAVQWLSGEKIIYLFDQNQETKLVRAKRDGSDFEVLLEQLPVGNPRFTISPDAKKVIIWRPYEEEGQEQLIGFGLWLYDLESRKLEELPPTGVTEPIWSPDGTHLAYLRIDVQKNQPQLAILDLNTKQETATDVATIGGKFVWQTNAKLIVASPKPTTLADLAQGSSLAATDEVWSVETTGKKQQLPTINGTPPLTDLGIDRAGRLIYRRINYALAQTLPETSR